MGATVTSVSTARKGTGPEEAGGTGAQRASQEEDRPLRDRFVFVMILLGRAYRALLASLLAIALVPGLWGWPSYLVRSGSMEPAVAAGDVVVAQPFGPDEKVPLGRVMLFRVPVGDQATQVRIHRVVGELGRGRFATAGDANSATDTDPVAREQFEARALLRVPYLGLPLVWWARGDFETLTIWLVASMVLLHFSFRRVTGRGRSAPQGRPPSSPIRRVPGALMVGGAAGLAVMLMAEASAAFTATTLNGSNTWLVGSTTQPYTTAVMIDAPYQFYRLDEQSGVTAVDAAGSALHGSYTAVAGYRQPGALPNNTGYAIRLAGGGGRMVAGGPGLSDPRTFSIELWFKTATTAGGKLIGFESTRNATSTYYDRLVLMRTDGRLVYAGGVHSSKRLISPTAFNDGAWHHLVVTSVPQGSQDGNVMYVDGTAVDANTTARPLVSYTGWWRVGYGRVLLGTGYPSTGNITAQIDDVAVYRSQLTAARVAAHYAAR